jgi:hypothetical protein
MQTITLKPERLAELEDYAKSHGQTPADALDELLEAQLHGRSRIIGKQSRAYVVAWKM